MALVRLPPSPPIFKISAQKLTAIISPNKFLVRKIIIVDEIKEPLGKIEDQLNMELNELKPKHKVRIVQAAVARLMKCGFTGGSISLVHDAETRPVIEDLGRLGKINDYYGSQIALYFAWCAYYTNWLVAPSIFGVIVYIDKIFYNSKLHLGFFFSIFVSIWSTCFLAFWRRQNSILAHKWNVQNFDKDELKISVAQSAGAGEDNKFLRLAVSFSVVVASLCLLVRLMIHFIYLQDNADKIYGAYNPMKYYPIAIYSCLPSVFSVIFLKLVAVLTDFEHHASPIVAENHRIYKTFSLQFVNRYCMLFYIAFHLKDMSRLQSTLISLLGVSQITGNISELLPVITSKVSSWWEKKDKNETEPDADKGEDLALAGYAKDMKKDSYDVGDDYMELLLQFGYVALFSVVFPPIPLLACVNNFFEGRVDFMKLDACKRPLVEERSGLGAWLHCFEFISFVGVLTNCCLISEVMHDLPEILPAQFSPLLEQSYGKLLAVVILEHIIFGVKILLACLISSDPLYIQYHAAEELLNESKVKNIHRVNHLFRNLKVGELGLAKITEEQKQREIEKNIAKAMAKKTVPQQFEINPFNFILCIVFPFFSNSIGVPMFLSIPAGLLFLTYMQVEKNRADYKAAMGVTSEADIIRHVLKEMPSWNDSADAQRVEWFNMILNKLWPHISEATDTKMKNLLQPTFTNIIKSKCLDAIANITLDKFSLGEICPKIKSIRVYDTNASTIRFDCEFVWSGK